jgi:ATP-binding cassette subfamily B (MDR/TAP) protein 1
VQVLFGDLMDVMGLQAAGKEMEDSFNEIALNMVLLGAGCFVAAWIGEAGWKVSGLRQSAMWRKTYLAAILRQDIGWFDVNNPGELSSKIAEKTQLIEEGIGSKLSLGSRMLMQGVAGMFIAFYYTWKMSLVLMAISPVAIFGAWYFSYASSQASGESSKAYAKAGGTASESLSELRTVAALGAEDRQADKYLNSLDEAKNAVSWPFGGAPRASGCMACWL